MEPNFIEYEVYFKRIASEMENSYDESSRNLEGHGDETGINSVNSDTSDAKFFVETGFDAGSVRGNLELRDESRFIDG